MGLTQEGQDLLAAFGLVAQGASEDQAVVRRAWAIGAIARLKSHILDGRGANVPATLIPLGIREAVGAQEQPFLDAFADALGLQREDVRIGGGIVSVEPDPTLPQCFCVALKPRALFAALRKRGV